MTKANASQTENKTKNQPVLKLPLKVGDKRGICFYPGAVVDAEGKVLFYAPSEMAAFIVRACNSHEALVHFVKRYAAMDQGDCACSEDLEWGRRVEFPCMKHEAKAALKLAGEGA